MKTLVGASFSFLILSSLFGQGTVTFLNDSDTLSSPPDRLVRFFSGAPFGTNNAPAVGTNWQVQLYYGASTAPESALIAVTTTPARLRASTTVVPGVWAGGGTRTLNNFPYGSGYVQLQVRVWDIYFGNTYEAAAANGGIVAKSASFLYLMPVDGLTPSNSVMANFTGFLIFDFDDPPPPPPSQPVIANGTPQSQSVVAGFTATFSASVTGTPALTYFWRFYGTNLPGATANPLVISNVQQSNTGPYSLVVTNAYGAATSAVVTLSLTQPGSATVWFQNDYGSLTAPPDRLVRFSTASTPGNVAGVDNAPAVGTNFLVQLYYGPASASEGALIPVTSAPAQLRPSTTSAPGIWAFGGTRTLTGFPHGSGAVTLQVRVWDTADGQTYEQAIAKQPPGVSGKSQTFLYNIPAAADYPPPNFMMSNFQGFFIASGNPESPIAPSLNDAYITSQTGFHFTLNGDPGARYRIEISTNGTSWDLLKVITNLTGSTQLDDQTIANSRARLYRAVLSP